MKELTNKIAIKDIVFADRWRERQERCRQINTINQFRNTLFHIIVTLWLSFNLIYVTLRYSGSHIKEDKLWLLIWIVCIGIITICYWKWFCGWLADVIDAIFIVKGHRPVFKQIGDTGAYVSNMIHKYPTSIYYDQNNVEIIVENKDGKKIILQECEIEHQNITEPRLDLNRMKVILPKKC